MPKKKPGSVSITAAVGKAVKRRREDELGLTQAEAVSLAGGTPKVAVWSSIERGAQRRADAKTLRGICRALGWAPDAIQSIMRGEEPELVPVFAADDPMSPASHSGSEGWPRALEIRFERYEASQRRLMEIQEIQGQRLELVAAEIADLQRSQGK